MQGMSPEALELLVQGVAVVMIGVVIAVAVIASSVRRAHERKEIERSRREVAAFVAEGTIRPDDAERILRTDPTGATSPKKKKDE